MEKKLFLNIKLFFLFSHFIIFLSFYRKTFILLLFYKEYIPILGFIKKKVEGHYFNL